jgi:hypothetical protein
VRKDYALLRGTNRHTVTATGWIQEENNLKEAAGAGSAPFVGREYGVARYERLKDADFSAADSSYATAREFWKAVMADWETWWQRNAELVLTAHSDQSGAFAELFQLADDYASGKLPAFRMAAAIRAAHAKQGVTLR